MTGCQCEQPGWCERHAVLKTKRWWELCRKHAEYFEAWENETGPGQSQPREQRLKKHAPLEVPFVTSGRIEWISTAKLSTDAITLSAMLPKDVDTIVAVPRSGMIPASVIACMLHLPLMTIVDGQIVPCGNGHRLCDQNTRKHRMAFIDDTLAGGAAQRKLIEQGLLTGNHIHAVVYSSVDHGPHIYMRHLPFPHLLEWNLFNSCYIPNVSTDMDGILCHNPPHDSTILYLPRRHRIKSIITARPASRRIETIRWLDEHDVQYERLLMWPHSEEAIDADALSQWKARMVQESGAEWYIESEPGISDMIRRHGVRVLCPKQGYLE